MQNEIKEKCKVPGENGHIKNPGYARREIIEYSRENIKAYWFRKKEWDYYLFNNDRFAVAFTISDLGYIGLLSASFIDLEKAVEHTESEIVVLPRGKKFKLGKEVRDANGECHTKRLDMSFRNVGDHRHISCNFRKFDGDKDLVCELDVYEPDMEAMYIATPWKEKPTAFYYNCKRNCLEAEGTIRYGDREEKVDRKSMLGCLDWGRGVWTYDNTWFWGTGSGRLDNGEVFGFNLGYGFSDRSSASENCIYYRDKIHKLDEVTFNIPEEDGKRHYTKPWKITSNDNMFEADFIPIIDRWADMDYKIIVSTQHQVFGRMSGYAVLEDGNRIEFSDFICALEVVRNKY